MNNTTMTNQDAVVRVRAVRDALSAVIDTMSVDEENRWLRSTRFSDATLRRLMARAAQDAARTDEQHG